MINEVNLLGLNLAKIARIKIMKIQLLCLLGRDSCEFVTIQLEFSQAREILETHMKLVHPVPDCRKLKCDKCDKDNDAKDIIEEIKISPVEVESKQFQK